MYAIIYIIGWEGAKYEQKAKQSIKDFVLTLLILEAAFGISMLMQNVLGIDSEKLDTIFLGYNEKFSDTSDAQKRNAGIGLSVCATIVKAHGGSITAENAKSGGANDYITKPFGSEELLARVRSALRNSRYTSAEARLPGRKFTSDDLVIDYEARQVFIADHEIKLTQTEYNIVAFLSDHCGKMMTYASIIKVVWREAPDDASIKKLQVNMANIRKKFGAHPGEISHIVNELGIGYRMKG